MRIRFIFPFTLSFLSFTAQIPVGYYNSASGLTGSALQNALHNIIKNHSVVPYSSLYSVYDSSDTKANGQVWDMYSDIPSGTPPYVYYNISADHCGTYTQEGDCYNREHSWPQSWFNGVSPPYSDAFHIFPTDGWVNNVRSNYPYGEVSNPTWTSLNGSKLGNNSTAGYSQTVFEPIDEYKGDIARGLLYMAVRYLGEDSGWANSPATNKATILPWYMCLLLNWHNQDPVSAKEVRRNDEIYAWQNNRNPFIDRPGFADSAYTCTLAGVNGFVKEPFEVLLYPNPATEAIHIKTGTDTHIKFYDALGQLVLSAEGGGAVWINVNGLGKGIYLIKLEGNNGTVTRRLVIN